MVAAFLTINIRLLNQMARRYFAYSNNTLILRNDFIRITANYIVKTRMVVYLDE